MARTSSAPLRLVGGTAVVTPPPPAARPARADAELVALLRGGDMGAFAVLYERHVGFALNLTVRIQGSAADAEDLVHDAFLKAHQHLAQLRDAAAFKAWLGSIVVRLVRSRMRRRRLLVTLGLSSREAVDLDSIVSPAASPEQRALLAQVYALLELLPPDERISWTLRHVEQQPLEQIAELTGCSLATTKRRLQRAQLFLSRHFVAPFASDSEPPSA